MRKHSYFRKFRLIRSVNHLGSLTLDYSNHYFLKHVSIAFEVENSLVFFTKTTIDEIVDDRIRQTAVRLVTNLERKVSLFGS